VCCVYCWRSAGAQFAIGSAFGAYGGKLRTISRRFFGGFVFDLLQISGRHERMEARHFLLQVEQIQMQHVYY